MRIPTIRTTLRWLSLLLALIAPAVGVAAPFGVVDQITEPTPRGQSPVAATGEAVVVRGGVSSPLEVGYTLEPGDIVRTQGARVVIVLAGAEPGSLDARQRVVVDEGSELEVGERGVLQMLGDVYYRVRGTFSAEYSSVEATVEGTEFLVAGGDTVTVGVAKGLVQVSSAGVTVPVKRGQSVTVTPGQAPPDPERWGRGRQAQQAGFTFPVLGPKLTVGGRAGFSMGRQGFGGVESFARLSLPGGARALFDLGVDGLVGPGVAVPLGAGLGYAFGPLTVGGQFTPTLVVTRYDCGTTGSIDLGGSGSAALSVPVAFGLRIEIELEGGWAGALVVDGSVGLGVDL